MINEIKILTPSGAPVDRRHSHPGFRDVVKTESLVDAGDQEISIDEFLMEEHHRYYGGPWCMGRFIFEKMVERGLQPASRVLDLGCGAGRVGIWLLPYLEPGNYCGIDVHLRSLEAFSRYEIPFHGLWDRRPRLVLDGEFNFEAFGQTFDVVCDYSVTAHLTPDQQVHAYGRIAKVLVPGGRVMLNHAVQLTPDAIADCGFEVTHTGTADYALMRDSAKWKKNRGVSGWTELTRLGVASDG